MQIIILYNDESKNVIKNPNIPINIEYIKVVPNEIDNVIIESIIVPIIAIAVHFPFSHKHFLFINDINNVSMAIPNIIHITVVIPVIIPVEYISPITIPSARLIIASIKQLHLHIFFTPFLFYIYYDIYIKNVT